MLDSSEPMDVQLQLLLRLQQIDGKISRLLEDMAVLPKELRSREESLQQKKQSAEKAEQAVKAEEARRRRLESDRKDQQQKLDKFREQSNSVKTNEQFHAIQHEISFVEAEIRRIEDEELISMFRSEDLEKERAAVRLQSQQETKLLEEERERSQAASGAMEEELRGLRQERSSLRQQLEPGMLAQYDRIASSSRKTALAQAAGQRCLSCQMALRPQFWNQIRDGVLLNCESCGRMLYFDPAHPNAPNAA